MLHTMYEETGQEPELQQQQIKQQQKSTATRRPRFVYRQQMQLLQRFKDAAYGSSCSSRDQQQHRSDMANMESEVRSLRQEVTRTQDSLRAATRRCRELVRELDNLTSEQDRERILRDQQLSRILRALLVLESRLKQEQKSIRQLLCEKDNVIRNQQLEIARLRRYTKNYLKAKRLDSTATQQQNCRGAGDEKEASDGVDAEEEEMMDSTDFQDHGSSLSKDIQKLKCEIITKLSESLDDTADDLSTSTSIHKTHSFAGSDISKASLTSSENTDASIITTTTDGSPSLLSTEGFCEGESTDVSPGSTLNKSSNRCTPTLIVTTDSEQQVTTLLLADHLKGNNAKKAMMARSESKDDGMDCNYASDEEDGDDEMEPIYQNACCDENNQRNLKGEVPKKLTARDDRSSNDSVQVTLTRIDDTSNQDESSGNWYSDPDEDRLNDELLRHSVYRPNPSNHNSVLECVNQILLRDMEDEEKILSVPRRFKHRGKIVRFQPARLSDIESVGSEMERRNSEEPMQTSVTVVATVDDDDGVAKDEQRSIDGFEATNSEDEFGMRIVPPPPLDPESGLEEDVEETKARPIVIIEPDETRTKSRDASSPKVLRIDRIEDEPCLQLSSLSIAKNLDYEDIESLPDVIAPVSKVPPALPPKPQFRNNTLILKKIPSPSFLIDETSRKKNNNASGESPGVRNVLGLSCKNALPARSLKFDDLPAKKNNNCDESTSFWRNRFNNVRSSFQIVQNNESPEPRNNRVPKVTNIVKQFEEFKIEGNGNDLSSDAAQKKSDAEYQVDNLDIQQNFEEFNLDECDLSGDDPDRPEADGSENFASAALLTASDDASVENNNATSATQVSSGSTYDSFLEATGLSNKSILTPSRLLSNHKSMLKPKDVKYKSKIKATAVLERHGLSALPATAMTTHTRHWTGPFV